MLKSLFPSGRDEAKIRYEEADFKIRVPGDYVVCAVTGTHIPIDDLKYWSFERQEPYVDAFASLKAEKGINVKA